MPKISVLIPARNEIYLQKTIEDVLIKARESVEVIVCLEGYWPPDWAEVVERSKGRVITIHNTVPKGMRSAINSCVAASSGEYLLKCDAHVMFQPGFDQPLIDACKKRVVGVPRRYRLDVSTWSPLNDGRPPVDYEYISFPGMGGREWKERAIERANVPVDDTPTMQGSTWAMRRDYFDFLELMDEETYGGFFNEAQEISLKAWLSGGHVRVVKDSGVAHWHKPKDVGRGYALETGLREQATVGMRKWLTGQGWHKQTRSLDSLIKQFAMPGWPEDWQAQVSPSGI